MPIFKGKWNVKYCNVYNGIKLLAYAKIVERELKRRVQELVNVDAKHFDSMLGRGTTDA